MRRTARLLTIVALPLLIALPASAQKVHVDYDRSADFESYETFAWAGNAEASLANESPLMHSRLKNAIEFQLTTAGLREDPEDPDLYVTYYTDSQKEVQFSTTGMNYGYGPGWGWDPYWGGGMTTTTTTSHTYERGTLVVDLWDAKTETAVWRGSAEAIVSSNPKKEAKQIDKAVHKMVRKFQKMYAKEN